MAFTVQTGPKHIKLEIEADHRVSLRESLTRRSDLAWLHGQHLD
jgi:hypothetical protein